VLPPIASQCHLLHHIYASHLSSAVLRSADYLSDAKSLWETSVANADTGAKFQSFDWDDKTLGVSVVLAMVTGEDRFLDAAQAVINAWLPGGSVPYTPKVRGCVLVLDDSRRTPPLLHPSLPFTMGVPNRRTLMPPRVQGLAYGASSASLSAVLNVALAATVVSRSPRLSEGTAVRYRTWAMSQLGYTLGATGRSFVVAFGVSPPLRPHHAGASCPPPPLPCDDRYMSTCAPNPSVIFGGVVGGPGPRDEFADFRADYERSEVALDYNAAFSGLLARALMAVTDAGVGDVAAEELLRATNSLNSSAGVATVATVTTVCALKRRPEARSRQSLTVGLAVAFVAAAALTVLLRASGCGSRTRAMVSPCSKTGDGGGSSSRDPGSSATSASRVGCFARHVLPTVVACAWTVVDAAFRVSAQLLPEVPWSTSVANRLSLSGLARFRLSDVSSSALVAGVVLPTSVALLLLACMRTQRRRLRRSPRRAKPVLVASPGSPTSPDSQVLHTDLDAKATPTAETGALVSRPATATTAASPDARHAPRTVSEAARQLASLVVTRGSTKLYDAVSALLCGPLLLPWLLLCFAAWLCPFVETTTATTSAGALVVTNGTDSASSFVAGDCHSSLVCNRGGHVFVIIVACIGIGAAVLLPADSGGAAGDAVARLGGWLLAAVGSPHLVTSTVPLRVLLAWSATVMASSSPCASVVLSALCNVALALLAVIALVWHGGTKHAIAGPLRHVVALCIVVVNALVVSVSVASVAVSSGATALSDDGGGVQVCRSYSSTDTPTTVAATDGGDVSPVRLACTASASVLVTAALAIAVVCVLVTRGWQNLP
jgi:hypothetical protein